ncbi:MAG: polysaccharide deacetylase family protein [Bdellovibrionota bacterium]
MTIQKFSRAIFVAGFLTGCSAASQHVPNRGPSSLHTMGLHATLAEISESADPRMEARAYVERLLLIELRAHGWMMETDHVFNRATAPVDLFSQPSYLKLMVAHPYADRAQQKIVDLYQEAHRLTLSEASTQRSRERAAKAALVLAGVHDALLHARHNVAERVLLNDLSRAIMEAGHKANPAAPPHPVVVPLEGEELYAAAEDSKEQLAQMVSELPESDDVKDEIEERALELGKDLAADSVGREPQSLAVFPTAAASGNIDGFNFPHGTWAITFDDGPNPQITEQDIANLTATNTKATFFWLAKNVELYPDVVKKVQAAGYPVEDHSWNHPKLDDPKDLARLGTNLDREINQSFALDTKVYGVKPRFFRCPYGAGFKDPVIRGMIAKLGMIHVRWNVDSLDWKDPSPASVQARVEQQMAVNGHGIILFHDIHTPALTVVPNLVKKNKGKIRWVNIPQIVDELNGVHTPHP